MRKQIHQPIEQILQKKSLYQVNLIGTCVFSLAYHVLRLPNFSDLLFVHKIYYRIINAVITFLIVLKM